MCKGEATATCLLYFACASLKGPTTLSTTDDEGRVHI